MLWYNLLRRKANLDCSVNHQFGGSLATAYQANDLGSHLLFIV